jgi:hypothetical protein
MTAAGYMVLSACGIPKLNSASRSESAVDLRRGSPQTYIPRTAGFFRKLPIQFTALYQASPAACDSLGLGCIKARSPLLCTRPVPSASNMTRQLAILVALFAASALGMFAPAAVAAAGPHMGISKRQLTCPECPPPFTANGTAFTLQEQATQLGAPTICVYVPSSAQAASGVLILRCVGTNQAFSYAPTA